MSYAAIDFELANAKATSVCALGVVIFEGNRETEEHKWLIRPPHGSGEFLPYHTKVHGITEEMVWEAPEFYEIWEELEELLQDRTLVAHNAPFDLGVLRKNCEYFGLAMDAQIGVCSCQISRKVWPTLPNHKLNTVSEALGIALTHHDPCSDARASGLILAEAMRLVGAAEPEEAARLLGVNVTVAAVLEGERIWRRR